MKTKPLTAAVLASAALIAQAQPGGAHGGGGGGFAAPAAPAHGPAPSTVTTSMRGFGGGRMIYSGQRFSPTVMRSPAFRQPYVNPTGRAFTAARQFTPGNINRTDHLTRFSNAGNHMITNVRGEGIGSTQIGRNQHNLPATWRNHVVAQHSADWHRDWDRNRDHWWRGHRCRFVNGSWFIFDFGFDPWWPYWWSPYNYYAYSYYPYGYYPTVYQGGYYDDDQSGYLDQYSDSTVAAAQERLAQRGYYRGAIDGVFGPETRRAIARYQSKHGLRVSGYLTADTLQDLGLRRG
jgi:hypothetical protein